MNNSLNLKLVNLFKHYTKTNGRNAMGNCVLASWRPFGMRTLRDKRKTMNTKV